MEGFLVRRLALVPLLAAGLFLAAAVQAEPVLSRVSSVEGECAFALPGSDNFQPLRKGMLLPSDSRIRTGEDGRVLVVVVNTVAMRIAEGTTVTLSDMEFAEQDGKVTRRKAKVDLSEGTVSALLDKDVPREATEFEISTPHGVTAARGTFYAVCTTGERSFVKVKSGLVGVREWERLGAVEE